MEFSENKKAEKIVGKRHIGSNTIAIDLPIELGYTCPFCKIASERLDWSEYNGFLYCYECNQDYPTCLCCDDINKAIDVYLDCINDLNN